MFTGIRLETKKISVLATSVGDIKNFKAFHDNKDVQVTVHLDELAEALGGGFASPTVVEDLEENLDYLQRELEGLQEDYDGVYDDLQTAEREVNEMSKELDQLSEVENELSEAKDTIESLEQEIESLHQEINDMEGALE